MPRIAFTMKLFAGCQAEYKKRHSELWPELQQLLKDNGISDYSIFLDEKTNILFAVLTAEDEELLNNLPLNPIMQKWWKYMADIMETNPDNSPPADFSQRSFLFTLKSQTIAMQIDKYKIDELNQESLDEHQRKFEFAASNVADAEGVLQKLTDFQIAIPSWALGTGGTRFGRFAGGGEPRSLEEKIEDIGLLHKMNNSSGAISLHIPWDIPSNAKNIKALAGQNGLRFDAMNSNTFQDQPGQKLSYKFGSMQHVDKAVRKQAIEHNIEVIKYGVELGSDVLSVWLSDGSNFPGQLNFRKAFENTLESLQEVYSALPEDWKLFVEYKAYEPNFYSTTVGDWGQSLLFANKLGEKAYTLVDLGHHLPNANIEQIVAVLLMEEKLGGFHFNDLKYADDDLTVGSINPYQLFLIFKELVEGMDARAMNHATDLAWMIDASHNVKDPLEDLLQSVEAIMIAYAQALLVNNEALAEAQQSNDVALAQETLQSAYRTDVRPLVAEARLRAGAALEPLQVYRRLKVRENLIKERGLKTVATGL